MPKTVPTKPYDWTYTTTYTGHTVPASSPSSWNPANPAYPVHAIPLAELTRPDPILFYAEVPLFEDELHDNGSSGLLVRIVSSIFSVCSRCSTGLGSLQRVMPTCIFILARFTLRVDGVLFRTFDTRIYSSLEKADSPIVVRETSGWEAPYEVVKNVSELIQSSRFFPVSNRICIYISSNNTRLTSLTA